MGFSVVSLIDDVTKVITKFIPDTAAKDAAKAEITTLMLQSAANIDAAQSDINKIEAANNSLFVSGWRPFIGWTCGVAFAGHYVLAPTFFFLKSCLTACAPQVYEVAEINNVLYLLLGFGAFRTVDKGVDIVMKAIK